MMTVHKLSAGDGYTYLTRQVASADDRRPAGQSLADYYTARGNPPGVWLGGGAEVLGVGGGQVSEAQMRSLFGSGRHPDAEALIAAGTPESATRLGAAYPVYADLAPYADRVAQRIAEFTDMNDRQPSASEKNGIAATEARRGRRAVAGYDLVFSPVKSVSLLWALGGTEVRREVEAAHHEAVCNAVGWLEKHAAYTRVGHGGAAQIDTAGLMCVAFDHRESRSGDPDLHTHVAVSNKVCGVDGKWRSLDARGLYALGVAASERYNTRLEDALARRLGVQFEQRSTQRSGKRSVREIVGIPTELIAHFSRRRALIEARLSELRRDYRATHGREPSRSTELQLAQQATLETREGKGPGRTLGEQVEDWTRQARDVVGERRVRRIASDCLHHQPSATVLDASRTSLFARRVTQSIAEQRATWTLWNVHAEAERQMRPLRFIDSSSRDRATEEVVAAATGPGLAIRITEPPLVREPTELVRASDTQSVFVPHGSDRFTTSEVLLAEDHLVEAGRSHGSPHLDQVVLEAALAIGEVRSGVRLDAGQRALVEAFALSDRRLAVGIGPAGAGKTTAMRALADAWRSNGGRVVALASSSKAAQVLGAELGLRSENLHKFLYENSRLRGPEDAWFTLSAGDLMLIDEAGMAGTLNLDRLVHLAEASGAAVRLLGDPSQLASVEAGGALQLLENEVGATFLTELHRFSDPEEAAATLALRRGEPSAIDFYERSGRIQAGSRDSMLDAAYDAWALDVAKGLTSVLVAGAGTDVIALNVRARTERIAAGQVESRGVGLHDGTCAGAGDWVITRANARMLDCHHRGWVHNGDTWRVVRRYGDGSLCVRRLSGKGTVRLPADYVSESLELAYAVTAHRAQGTTTDTAHALITSDLGREVLYVASTRARHGSHWYVATDKGSDLDCDREPEAPLTAREVIGRALARCNREGSATETVAHSLTGATSMATLVSRYEHAWSLAAHGILGQAAEALPASVQNRVVNGAGASHLARTLAMAASDGADPRRLLTMVYDLDDLPQTQSPALILASRIQDHRRTLGISSQVAPEAPLPWLPGPNLGIAGWQPYLQARARLITDRLRELGSLSKAYREQYDVAEQDGSLGPPPEPGTRRSRAFQIASAEQDVGVRRRPLPTDRTDPRPQPPAVQAVHISH